MNRVVVSASQPGGIGALESILDSNHNNEDVPTFNWWNMPGFFKTYWVYPVWLKSRATLEKVGLVWKKPYFFFKRLKLDQLGKSRAFSKQALLFPENARLFRLKLRTLVSLGRNLGRVRQHSSCARNKGTDTIGKVVLNGKYKIQYVYFNFHNIISFPLYRSPPPDMLINNTRW